MCKFASVNFVADIGNTSIKAAFYEGLELVELFTDLSWSDFMLKAQLGYATLVSTTRNETLPETVNAFSSSSRIPIGLDYDTPNTLGSDRLAAAIGANGLYSGSDILVLDAGTALTIDLVSKGSFRGGSISPGLGMRFKALNNFTGKLPLVDHSAFSSLPGKSTDQSIGAGVVAGMLAEIEGIVSHYTAQFEDLKVILTGGDAGLFETKIKQDIFVHPNLVLEGLNRVLIYNVERES